MPPKKPPKLSVFIQDCMTAGNVRPADMKREYEAKYPTAKKKTLEAYLWQLKKMGLTKEKRDLAGVDIARKAASKHVLDYSEMQQYELAAGQSRIQQRTIDKQKFYLTKLWQIMNCTDPHTWTYTDIILALEKVYPKVVDARGRTGFSKPGAVGKLLSAMNTIFPGKLPKGFGSGLTREAGELKDFLTFEEFSTFIDNLADSFNLSREGWMALFTAQVNMGCREGTRGSTGILSLRWEDIDYFSQRCSIHDKGGRGNAARLWKNVPLNLFPWINGWAALMNFHQQRFGYIPSNDRHEAGFVFSNAGQAITYDEYRHQFHDTRKRCNGRISGGKETLRPHIIRRTHAQWLVKLWYPIEQICGLFPDGHLGVGWDNPKICMKYYVTLEDEQRFRAEKTAQERMQALHLITAPEVMAVAQAAPL